MKNSPHLTPAEISGFLDGEPALDAGGKKHISSCSRCAGLLKQQEKLRRLARATRPQVPTERMWSAIKDGISREPAPRPGFWAFIFRRPRWQLAGAASAAATAMLAVIVFRGAVEKPLVPVTPSSEMMPAEIGRAPGGAGSRPAPTEGPGEMHGGALGVASAPEKASPDQDDIQTQKKETEGIAAWAVNAPARESREPAQQKRSKAASGVMLAAAPQSAPEISSATAPPRTSYTGILFVLSAEKMNTGTDGIMRASGRVSARPAGSSRAYFAVVDGLSRTLTGTQEAVSAEILPGQRLILHTR